MLIAAIEASITGSLQLSNDKWGQFKDYRTGEVDIITCKQLENLWFWVKNVMDRTPSTTLEQKLSLFCARYNPSVYTSNFTEFPEEEILNIQIRRMKSLLRGWGSIRDEQKLVEEIERYKKENSKQFELLFKDSTSYDVAEELIRWRTIILNPIDVTKKNYHQKINKRMRKIAKLNVKPLSQELREINEKRNKQDELALARYTMLENW